MDISSVFEPGGLLSESLEDYEPRPSQIKMATSVADAFKSCRPLVVEAGTGTGKTLAYLVPAILDGKQVVISTGTKNLQEQVYFKDIPYLKKNLGVDFDVVMMKGRSNYLCNDRLKLLSQGSMFKSPEEIKSLKKINAWAKTTKTGDLSELSGIPESSSLWSQVHSTTDFCSARKCPRQTDCFISRLRKKAEESQLIVVNHHLFFADLAIREKNFSAVLPDYDAVIFDEAHQIEDIASAYFGSSISNHRFDELIRDTVKEADKGLAKKKGEFIKDLDNLDSRSKIFFHSFTKGKELRFSLADNQPDETATNVLIKSLDAIESKLSGLKETTDQLRILSTRYLKLRDELELITARKDENYIFWGEARGKGVYLHASSIDVSQTMKDTLYSRCTAIFTSATLASASDFSYFTTRLGLEDAETLLLESPFDYQKQVSIYLPQLPEPNSPAFIKSLSEESLKLINLVKGRTLFLFTSFRNMYDVRRVIEEKVKYKILMQGEASKHKLLEQFREEVDSILLATSSFWQGIDVKGEALSCVIIDRLPFASPGDPVISARIERIKKNGGNAFKDYQVPFAVLSLKQGLGRLIRHRNDKGIIMIADRRITAKSYGKIFMKSLPPATITDLFANLKWER